MPPASHFLFIPGVLLIGVVIGWILGSRAAADAYAMQLRRMQEKQARGAHASQPEKPDSPSSPS